MEHIRTRKEWFAFVKEIREYFLEKLKMDLMNEWEELTKEEEREH